MKKLFVMTACIASFGTYAQAAPSGMTWKNSDHLLAGVNLTKILQPCVTVSSPACVNIIGNKVSGQPARKYIFIGSAYNVGTMMLARNADHLINSGKVGLYLHGMAVTYMSNADRQKLGEVWSSASTGLNTGGEGQSEIEIDNGNYTTFSGRQFSASTSHPDGDTLHQEANINVYNGGTGDTNTRYVALMPGQKFSAPLATAGGVLFSSYAFASTLKVTIKGLPAGITFDSSTFTVSGSAPSSVGKITAFITVRSPKDPSNRNYNYTNPFIFDIRHDAGVKPGNIYMSYTTLADYNALKNNIDSIFQHGVINAAPVATPNSGGEDTDGDFATEPFWEYSRAMALYGGAITCDTSPTIFFNGSIHQKNYPETVASLLRWAQNQGIRSTVIFSPSYGKFDPTLLPATQAEVGYLASQNALPNEFVVENFILVMGPHGPTGDNGANEPTGDYVAGSLNEVAQYLTTVDPSPYKGTMPLSPYAKPQNAMVNSSPAQIWPKPEPAWRLGSLSSQDATNFTLTAGSVGEKWSSVSKIDIFLGHTSTFLSVHVPLIFQGNGGNAALNSSFQDANLHLNNPYSHTKTMLAFGPDCVDRFNANNTSCSTSGEPAVGPDDTGQYLRLRGENTNVDSNLYWGVLRKKPILYSGAGNISTKNIIQDFHTSGYPNNFDTRFSFSGGAKGSDDKGKLDLYAGKFTVINGITVGSKTRSEILALKSPAEGTLLYDRTDHNLVNYRCPNGTTCGWYPLAYGAMISN